MLLLLGSVGDIPIGLADGQIACGEKNISKTKL